MRRPSVPNYILFTYVLSYLTISYLFTYSAVNGFKDKSHQPIRLSFEIRKRSFAKALSVNSSHKTLYLKTIHSILDSIIIYSLLYSIYISILSNSISEFYNIFFPTQTEGNVKGEGNLDMTTVDDFCHVASGPNPAGGGTSD